MEALQFRLKGEKVYLDTIDVHDADDFFDLLSTPRVASMLRRLPQPWDQHQARKWVERRAFQGRPGFVLKIIGREFEFLGFIGISGVSNSLMYALVPEAEGHGIASDALNTFVAFVFSRFDIEKVRASTALVNARSADMLIRMGFELVGQEEYVRQPGAQPETLNTFELKRPKGDS